MSKELLKRILNALSIINHSEGISGWHLNGDVEPWGRTEFPGLIEEIEAELAKPEPEPVAHEYTSTCGGRFVSRRVPAYGKDAIPLYAHPSSEYESIRAIERALGIE